MARPKIGDRKALSKTRNTAIVQQAATGRKYHEIAKSFGISKSQVCRIIQSTDAKNILNDAALANLSLLPLAQFHLAKILEEGNNQERLRAIQLVFETTGLKQPSARSEAITNIYNQIFNDNRQITVEQSSQIKEFFKFRHGMFTDNANDSEKVESTSDS